MIRIGIDLGGTNIVVGTVSEDGSEILGQESRPTPVEKGPEGVVQEIATMVRASMEAANTPLLILLRSMPAFSSR